MNQSISITLFFSLSALVNVAQVPTDFKWAKKAGGTGTDEGKAIIADKQGNTYVGGYYKNTATFGALPTITALGGHDAFITKYDSSGNAVWINSIGGTDVDEINGVSIDTSGNVFVAGIYGTSTTAGSTTVISAGSIDFFIAKYSSSGSLVWIKSAGGVNADYVYGIKTDVSGNSFVTGKFNTATTIGTINLTSSGQDDIFIAKYDSSGTVLWAKKAGGSSGDFAKAISLDGNGNIYITGNFSGTATFLGTPNVSLSSSGQWDVFTAKYDASGNVLWAKKGGGTDHDHGLSIETDMDGNSVVSGYYQSVSVNFSGTILTNAGNWDMFVARYNSSGTLAWAKKYGSTEYDYSYGVTIDRTSQIIITGGFGGTVSFGSFPLTSTNATTEDFFITKIDTSGNVLWAIKAGAPANEYTWGNAVTTDWSGDIYATGTYEGTASFGTTTLLSSGGDETYGEDIFVCKIDQATITSSVNQNNLLNEGLVKIYPSVTSGKINISSVDVLKDISVYNSIGQKVFTISAGNNHTLSIEIGNQPEGIYFLRVKTDKGIFVKKVIVAF